MENEATRDVFIERLTGNQSRMYAYIYSLTGNADTAKDVLQETNKVLWQKVEQYDSQRDFLPWAFTVAYHQVRAARTRERRDRLVFQDDATITALADAWTSDGGRCRLGDRQVALEHCMGELSAGNQELLGRYYKSQESVETISRSLERRANSVAVALHRLRQSLAHCIKDRLTATAGQS